VDILVYTETEAARERLTMIPWTQQATRRGERVARPRTGEMPIQHVRAADDDWADLDTASDGRRPEVVREFIRWYLRRPGSRLPDRPPVTDWPAARLAAAQEWFSSLGHDIDPESVEPGEADRPQWRCRKCGSHVSVGAKGKAQSPSGSARCPRGLADEGPSASRQA